MLQSSKSGIKKPKTDSEIKAKNMGSMANKEVIMVRYTSSEKEEEASLEIPEEE